jgi:16S rRNA (uracil1498-N3)-methyltransferase
VTAAQRAELRERAAAVAQIKVDDLDAPAPSNDDAKHLARVLRVRPGESVVIIDGRGAWRMCVWRADETLEPVGDVRREVEVQTPLTVAFSLLKGDRNEWVVQKLTELGVDRIAPLMCERTVVKWDATKAERNRERLERVAYEAAMQSRRIWLPEVLPVRPLVTAAAELGPLCMAEPGGAALTTGDHIVAIGPEGGWSDEELTQAARTIDLGPTILRAETAAVTAGVLLATLRADRGANRQVVPSSQETG